MASYSTRTPLDMQGVINAIERGVCMCVCARTSVWVENHSHTVASEGCRRNYEYSYHQWNDSLTAVLYGLDLMGIVANSLHCYCTIIPCTGIHHQQVKLHANKRMASINWINATISASKAYLMRLQ